MKIKNKIELILKIKDYLNNSWNIQFQSLQNMNIEHFSTYIEDKNIIDKPIVILKMKRVVSIFDLYKLSTSG